MIYLSHNNILCYLFWKKYKKIIYLNSVLIDNILNDLLID